MKKELYINIYISQSVSSVTVATAEFSKFAGVLHATLSQHFRI